MKGYLSKTEYYDIGFFLVKDHLYVRQLSQYITHDFEYFDFG